MAAPVLPILNIANRHDQTWYAGPLSIGIALPSPVFTSDLPTSDPLVAGQLYNNAKVVTESTGS
jgi:hypothetical protein